MIRRLRAEARWIAACLIWAAQSVGYWIRPYDMLADRRRWRWQPRQRCGFSHMIQCPSHQPTAPSTKETPA